MNTVESDVKSGVSLAPLQLFPVFCMKPAVDRIQILFESISTLGEKIYADFGNTCCFIVYEKDVLFTVCLLQTWIFAHHCYHPRVLFMQGCKNLYNAAGYNAIHFFLQPSSLTQLLAGHGLQKSLETITGKSSLAVLMDPEGMSSYSLFRYNLNLCPLPQNNSMYLNGSIRTLILNGEQLRKLDASFTSYASTSDKSLFSIAKDFGFTDISNILVGRDKVREFLSTCPKLDDRVILLFDPELSQQTIRRICHICSSKNIPLIPYESLAKEVALLLQENL